MAVEPVRTLTDLRGAPVRTLLRQGQAVTSVRVGGLWLSLGLAFLAGGGRIVTPLTVQHALDHGLLSARPAAGVVGRAVAVGAGGILVAVLASWWLNRRIHTGTERAVARLRTAGLARSHQLAPETLQRGDGGDLVSRLTSDLDAVSTFVHDGGVVLLVNLAQMVIAAVLITTVSWQLAVPVVALAVLLLVSMRRLQAVVARRFVVVRERVAGLHGALTEAATGVAVIRSTGTRRRTQRTVEAAIERTATAQRHTLVPLHTSTALGELAISAMTTLVVVAGVRWSVGHTAWEPDLDLSAGELVALLLLVTFFVRPLQALVQLLGEAQNALAGWRRALEVVATPSAVVAGAGARELPAGAVDVTVRDVRAGYEDGPDVLRDVSVHVAAGESVAVVGETGSGKSTFAKLLTRQLTPRAGVVSLAGVPLGELADASLHRRVAIVPQDPFLFDATIGENVLIGLRDAADPDAALHAIVDALGLRPWVESFPDGLATRVGVRGDRLSAGERQLVALARTALVDPDLLVLDEATSGVDPATDVRLQTALGGFAAGRTTVTIAHRMVTAEGADRILVFDKGRLVQNGSHAELAAVDGRYAELRTAWVGHTAATPVSIPLSDDRSAR